VGQNNIGRVFDIPWVGGQNNMDRGKIWKGGQNTIGRGFKIPWIVGLNYHVRDHNTMDRFPIQYLLL
jgi:hypothetical protein